MTKTGAGVAAVRERIRQSFLAIHNDQRDREQRQADQEMLAVIEAEDVQAEAEVVETPNLPTRQTKTTERRASDYVRAALRCPYVAKSTVQRSNVHGAYVVEEPSEDAATLIAQALQSLE